jgi:hypothetical protein
VTVNFIGPRPALVTVAVNPEVVETDEELELVVEEEV